MKISEKLIIENKTNEGNTSKQTFYILDGDNGPALVMKQLILADKKDPYFKVIKETNGTFLLERVYAIRLETLSRVITHFNI